MDETLFGDRKMQKGIRKQKVSIKSALCRNMVRSTKEETSETIKTKINLFLD